ncbi:hypothetical protein ABI59_13175 [Acidobacteria bacterium Mor1]|nr:hypothetical protein ABI59_13175 [Acidobacteria bacterium Mor1]
MAAEQVRHRSRWMMRALEWNDPRARYPNIWQDGMPRHVLAYDTVAHRLRLGDLIAIYHPESKKHQERANRFLGLSRVVGLREADDEGFCWIDLAIAHRFSPGLDLGMAPRRVFMCCDPAWPGPDVTLFRAVFDAAVSDGFRPAPADLEGPAEPGPAPAKAESPSKARGKASTKPDGSKPESTKPADTKPDVVAEAAAPEKKNDDEASAAEAEPAGRVFGGVDFSGDMRDPRQATWLCLLEQRGDRLRVLRLEATGRQGLQARLRDPDALLMRAEAIGLDFPFSLPRGFAARLSGDGEEGWWNLAQRFEQISRPEYLVALQEFRDAEGEVKRLTDERAGAFSPLHRVNPDLGPMTYHGIRTIAEERSRYTVRPFESATGRLLLEAYPGQLVRSLRISGNGDATARRRAIIDALGKLSKLPLELNDEQQAQCAKRRDALDAVIAARCAARAVLSGEAAKTPEDLCPDDPERVRVEGWIYGLESVE